MTKYLIVNADDFGYSYSINKGIVEAHRNGIVTSTSVLVDAIASHEAKDLIKHPNLSIGLHFELKDLTNVRAELARQIQKFISIVGRHPDHIDTHKRHTTDEGIKEVLQEYAQAYKTPVRCFGVKHIGSFGIGSNDSSVEQLKRSINEATEPVNELMTHVGYVDSYLRQHSSYSNPREDELASICSPLTKQYILLNQLQLTNWRAMTAKLHYA